MTEKKEKQEEIVEQDLKEMLQRTQANFENYRKQTDKRFEDVKKMASKDTILQILPIIDNFSLALKSVDKEKNQEDFVKGVELIYAQLNALLEQNDVQVIDTNSKFDPYYHEALLKVPSDLEENMIIEEFQKGYTMAGQVIRHAKVKVSAGGKDNDK